MNRSTSARVLELLSHRMTAYERRLNRDLIRETHRAYVSFQRRLDRSRRKAARDVPRVHRAKWRKDLQNDRRRPENSPIRSLLDFLRHQILQNLERLEQLAVGHSDFRKSLGRVTNEAEATRLLLDYATDLGSTPWQRILDEHATRRWLDAEAMHDRYERRRGRLELELVYLLDRFQIVAVKTIRLISQLDRAAGVSALWDRVGFDHAIAEALAYSGDARVRVAGMRCLRGLVESSPREVAAELVSDDLQALVHKTSVDPAAEIWIQCEAIQLLRTLDSALFYQAVTQRLAHPNGGDDLFVRRHCIRCLADVAYEFSKSGDLWNTIEKDPSDAVRQQLAASVWKLPKRIALDRVQRLASDDPSPQVRAMALLEAVNSAEVDQMGQEFFRFLATRYADEKDEFVLRVALHVATEWLEKHARQVLPDKTEDRHQSRTCQTIGVIYDELIVPAIQALAVSADAIPVRRWATEARERLWCLTYPEARKLRERLAGPVGELAPGRSCRVPARWFQGIDDSTRGRVLAVLTAHDLGIDLEPGWRTYQLTRRPVFGFRWWRVWHEFWRPATDKRQAFRHTVGRIHQAGIRAPSRLLGELSQTKVPGEPLVMPSEGTWRPFLPLLDDFVTALNRSWLVPQKTVIYSSEGRTEISVSSNPLKRCWAGLCLTIGFDRLAQLRNWEPTQPGSSRAYVAALERLGFRVRFQPHSVPVRGVRRPAGDDSVTQFFPALALLATGAPWGPVLWARLYEYTRYFGSMFENTLPELVLFTSIGLSLFLANHLFRNRGIAGARRKIPVSIGGWGTRGKSGTERLKAALFSAAGHPLVSKTTGCEAMFIHGEAMGEPLEVPLYRPSDKATIWEQSHLLRAAARLRPSVFLWECMALSPDYVDVLSRQWMVDDLTTITNTYPDHEDLQGPAGYNVATTIAGFVPPNSRVITSEQQMRPLLAATCRAMSSPMESVNWLQSGMIAEDLLDRFPYREHPDNIALVTALANQFGWSPDFAIKAMADCLIPDLGVLKTHPPAEVRRSHIEFTNGMSANERFGCLGNWQRLGFDRQDPYAEPNVLVSTVVNNRADRVARSRVFAQMLVNDLEADLHFLIGSNLTGLQGMIQSAWDEFVANVSLAPAESTWSSEAAIEQLSAYARRFRIPQTTDHVRQALIAMLSGAIPSLKVPAETLEAWIHEPGPCEEWLLARGVAQPTVQRVRDTLHQRVTQFRQFTDLQQQISSTDHVQVDAQTRTLQQLRTVLKQWFNSKLVVIEDQDATGEELLDRIVTATPPGFLNRIMGLQNIKGTGLDFVYRFQAWDVCHDACQQLRNGATTTLDAALHQLDGLPEYGQLCQVELQRTIDHLRANAVEISPESQLQLESIQKRLDDDRKKSQALQTSGGSRRWPWLRWIVGQLEEWREVHDSLQRRRTADLIYQDLGRERIGRQRAVAELRKLNLRQKGGWLAKQWHL